MKSFLSLLILSAAIFAQEPVDSEPSMPEETEIKDLPGYTPVLGGGYIRELNENGVRTKWIVISGSVNMQSGAIEVFATLGPKDHEAVLKVFCNIFTFNIALLNLGLKASDIPQKFGEDDPSDVGRVLVFVQYKDEKGDVKTYRAEDFLANSSGSGSMPRVGWFYQAKFEQIDEKRKILRAGESQLIVTSWRDPWSLVDNPLKEAFKDSLFVANKNIIPKVGTRISLIFRKPSKDELAEIKKIEKKLEEK